MFANVKSKRKFLKGALFATGAGSMVVVISCGSGSGENEGTKISVGAEGETTKTVTVDTNNNNRSGLVKATEQPQNLGKATLKVGNTEYVATEQDGRYVFNIKVPANVTEAILKIEKPGFVPVEKKISLKGDNISLKAQLQTAISKTVDKAQLRAGENESLVIALTKNGDIKTYSSLKKAVSDESNTLVISANTTLIDKWQDISKIKVKLRKFEPTPEDISAFPGVFKDDKGNTIETGGFSFEELTAVYQNGTEAPLRANPSKARDSCLWRVEKYLSSSALETIKNHGDSDEDKPGCQVPIYVFDYEKGVWSKLGTADVKLSNGTLVECNNIDTTKDYAYYADICVTNSEIPRWLNIDWVTTEKLEEKKVHLKFVDDKGNPLSNVWVEIFTNNYWYGAATNSTGEVDLTIYESKTLNVNNYTLNYYSSTYGYGSLNLGGIVQNATAGSYNYEGTITIPNPYDAKLVIQVKNGANKYVCVQGITDSTYFNCGYTDANGGISFPVKKGETYRIYGAKLKETTVTVDEDIKTISLTEANTPPEVYIYIYPNPVKVNGTATVSVSAFDIDGDSLQIEEFKVDNQTVEVKPALTTAGYLYLYKTITGIESNKTISVKISDGNTSETREATISVKNNIPPVITYIEVKQDKSYIAPENGIYHVTQNKDIKIKAYGYDPDGNIQSWEISPTDYVVEQNKEAGEFTLNFDKVGNYTLTVKAIDDNGAYTERQITFSVLDDIAPTITDFTLLTDKTLQLGDQYPISFTLEDKDNTKEDFTIKVYITNDNFTSDNILGSYTLTESWQSGVFWGRGEIEIPTDIKPGLYNLKLEVSDGIKTDTKFIKNIPIGNRPPEIVYLSPIPEEVEIGNEISLKVTVKDPDNDDLTVIWYVDDKQQKTDVGKGEVTSVLDWSSDEEGIHKIKLEITDGKNTITREWNITVYNPNAQKIRLYLPVAGAYVATLDNDFNVQKLYQADENGIVEIDKPDSSTVNLAFVLTPDVFLTKEQIWEITVFALANQNENNYRQGNLEFNATYWNGVLTTGEVKVEDLQKIPFAKDLTKINPSWQSWSDVANDLDSNEDGRISKDELYSYILSKLDKNGDGEIELSETKEYWSQNWDNGVTALVLGDIPVDAINNYHLLKPFLINNLVRAKNIEGDTNKLLYKFVQIELPFFSQDSEEYYQIYHDTLGELYEYNSNKTRNVLAVTIPDENGKWSVGISYTGWGENNNLIFKGKIFFNNNDSLVINSPDDLDNAEKLSILNGTVWPIYAIDKAGFFHNLFIADYYGPENYYPETYIIPTDLPKYGDIRIYESENRYVEYIAYPIKDNEVNATNVIEKAPFFAIVNKGNGILEFKTSANAGVKSIWVDLQGSTPTKGFALEYFGPYKEQLDLTKVENIFKGIKTTSGNLYDEVIKSVIDNGTIKIENAGINLYPLEETYEDVIRKYLSGQIVGHYYYEVDNWSTNQLPDFITPQLVGQETYNYLKVDPDKVLAWFITNEDKTIYTFAEDGKKVSCGTLELSNTDVNMHEFSINITCGNQSLHGGYYPDANYFYYYVNNNFNVQWDGWVTYVSDNAICISGEVVSCSEEVENCPYGESQNICFFVEQPEIKKEDIEGYVWNIIPEKDCAKFENGTFYFLNDGQGNFTAIGNYTVENGKVIVTTPEEQDIIEPIDKTPDGNLLFAIVVRNSTSTALDSYELGIHSNSCWVEKLEESQTEKEESIVKKVLRTFFPFLP